MAPSAILGLNKFLDSLNLQKLGLIVLLVRFYCHHSQIKVVIITDLEHKQKSALNAENTTDLPQTLQVPSLCCFS